MALNQRPFVQFDSIKVNSIETNSGIFVGTNHQFYWSSTENSKAGFGSITGHQNQVARNINVLNDDDIVDSPIHRNR